MTMTARQINRMRSSDAAEAVDTDGDGLVTMQTQTTTVMVILTQLWLQLHCSMAVRGHSAERMRTVIGVRLPIRKTRNWELVRPIFMVRNWLFCPTVPVSLAAMG